jgi:hypothetical protein
MIYDRTTIHGNKFMSDDFRGTVIQAGTLAFLLAYYPSGITAGLATDEIVVHQNMSLTDLTDDLHPKHIEFDPAKTYSGWGQAGSLITNLNEVKLRWNPAAANGTASPGAFEPCKSAGTQPRWIARMSDTSISHTNTPFLGVFETSTTETGGPWNTVASWTFDSHVAGQTDFRQIDWDQSFYISAADVGVAGGAGITAKTLRKLRFRADSTHALTERDEQNNEWQVGICLYPATDTTCASPFVTCQQP